MGCSPFYCSCPWGEAEDTLAAGGASEEALAVLVAVLAVLVAASAAEAVLGVVSELNRLSERIPHSLLRG